MKWSERELALKKTIEEQFLLYGKSRTLCDACTELESDEEPSAGLCLWDLMQAELLTEGQKFLMYFPSYSNDDAIDHLIMYCLALMYGYEGFESNCPPLPICLESGIRMAFEDTTVYANIHDCSTATSSTSSTGTLLETNKHCKKKKVESEPDPTIMASVLASLEPTMLASLQPTMLASSEPKIEQAEKRATKNFDTSLFDVFEQYNYRGYFSPLTSTKKKRKKNYESSDDEEDNLDHSGSTNFKFKKVN